MDLSYAQKGVKNSFILIRWMIMYWKYINDLQIGFLIGTENLWWSWVLDKLGNPIWFSIFLLRNIQGKIYLCWLQDGSWICRLLQFSCECWWSHQLSVSYRGMRIDSQTLLIFDEAQEYLSHHYADEIFLSGLSGDSCRCDGFDGSNQNTERKSKKRTCKWGKIPFSCRQDQSADHLSFGFRGISL